MPISGLVSFVLLFFLFSSLLIYYDSTLASIDRRVSPVFEDEQRGNWPLGFSPFFFFFINRRAVYDGECRGVNYRENEYRKEEKEERNLSPE